MSPLWREEIAIWLAPRKITLVRRGRGPKHAAVAATELAVPETDGVAVFYRLADALRDKTWQRAAARVVVADHPWIRYAIVPPPATSLDAAGRLSHARYVLDDQFGEAVAGWTVTLADAPPGKPCLACAMMPTLRSEVQNALAPAQVKLASLQPRLIASFNVWRRRLPADGAWFVTVEDGSLAAAHLDGGAWDRVHVARLSDDFRLELARLQAFGRLTRADGGPVTMFVDAPAAMRGAAGDGIEWLHEDGLDRPQDLALLQRIPA